MGKTSEGGPVKPFDEGKRAAAEAERENAPDQPTSGTGKTPDGGSHPDKGPNQQGEGEDGVGA